MVGITQPVVVARLGLHAHDCSECMNLRPCYADPCAFRGRQTLHVRRAADTQWVCGECREKLETAAASEKAA
jgi:hypothetical protein